MSDTWGSGPGPWGPPVGAPPGSWGGTPGGTAPWGGPYRAAPAISAKGARFGLPPVGVGSVASPGQRLGARLLDGLILLPVTAAVLIPLMIALIHRVQRVPLTLPDGQPTPAATVFGPLRADFLLALVGLTVVAMVWEGAATAIWGRTPGKAVAGIRAVPTADPGRRLSTARSFGRAATYAAGGLLGLLSLLDILWCLWDPDAQCLHDKVASTVVVRT